MPTDHDESNEGPERRFQPEDVKTALNRVGVDLKCPACSGEGKSVVGDGQLMAGASSDLGIIAVLVIICRHCGFVRQFDSSVLQVQPR